MNVIRNEETVQCLDELTATLENVSSLNDLRLSAGLSSQLPGLFTISDECVANSSYMTSYGNLMRVYDYTQVTRSSSQFRAFLGLLSMFCVYRSCFVGHLNNFKVDLHRGPTKWEMCQFVEYLIRDM